MENWPQHLLGDPIIDYRFSETAANMQRSADDMAAVQQARRFRANQKEIPVSFKFNKDQLAIFRAWRFHKIAQGNDWFEMDLWLGGSEHMDVPQAKVRMVEGIYGVSYSDGIFVVSFLLEVENKYVAPL